MSEEYQEYLTFLLNNEEYGVDILSVQEIMVWSPVTEIPDTPEYFKGVINLRGVIVPIVDLGERFGSGSADYNAATVIIVLRAVIEGSDIVVGLVVDAVSDVYKVYKSEIKNVPNFGTNMNSQFLSGMATVNEKIIILLDANKLLTVDKLYSACQRPASEMLAS